jgi:hypothetical protein
VFEVGGVGFGGSLDHMGHYPIRDSNCERLAPIQGKKTVVGATETRIMESVRLSATVSHDIRTRLASLASLGTFVTVIAQFFRLFGLLGGPPGGPDPARRVSGLGWACLAGSPSPQGPGADQSKTRPNPTHLVL